MSSIAYITDCKMLELHRLNNHQTINFWRLSNKTNFKDFTIGDLVFFLSKDKQHQRKKEKGIVGFGRLNKIHLNSLNYMWNKYGILNGYNDLKQFKEAVIKASKNKKLPSKISSFYLEDVVFFQPIYLSECGVQISNNIESYIYLDYQTNIKLLQLANKSQDLWSSFDNNDRIIKKHEILTDLFMIHKKIGDIKLTDKEYKKADKCLNNYKNAEQYQFIYMSKNELYKYEDNKLTIILYHNADIDERLLLGQAQLYRHYMKQYYKKDIEMVFESSDNNLELNNMLNNNSFI